MGLASMRYTHGNDWVEIVGAAERTLGDLQRPLFLPTWGAQHKAAVEMTENAHFEDKDGNEITEWRESVVGLTYRQWDWWRDQFMVAARAEIASPEA